MRKDNLSSEDINPGQELKKVLENLYPLNQEELSFVGEIDRSFKEDGKLVEIFYQSTINYLIRRLINTTEYLKREHESSELQNKLFITKLRNFFQQETWIDDENIERLISILQLCIDEKKTKTQEQKKGSH
ncbi:MAG: hypothetical protein HC920_14380 [Oscillatoriales cyanobacterium SM2_3_0]|nr:hypothetical protein [Oscillatoriales cyanobacterium SM2_3_0]